MSKHPRRESPAKAAKAQAEAAQAQTDLAEAEVKVAKLDSVGDLGRLADGSP